MDFCCLCWRRRGNGALPETIISNNSAVRMSSSTTCSMQPKRHMRLGWALTGWSMWTVRAANLLRCQRLNFDAKLRQLFCVWFSAVNVTHWIFFLYRASKWNKVFFVLNKLDGWFGGIWPDCLWVVVERMAGNEQKLLFWRQIWNWDIIV